MRSVTTWPLVCGAAAGAAVVAPAAGAVVGAAAGFVAAAAGAVVAPAAGAVVAAGAGAVVAAAAGLVGSAGLAGAGVLVGGAAGEHAAMIAPPARTSDPPRSDRRLTRLFMPAKCIPSSLELDLRCVSWEAR